MQNCYTGFFIDESTPDFRKEFFISISAQKGLDGVPQMTTFPAPKSRFSSDKTLSAFHIFFPGSGELSKKLDGWVNKIFRKKYKENSTPVFNVLLISWQRKMGDPSIHIQDLNNISNLKYDVRTESVISFSNIENKFVLILERNFGKHRDYHLNRELLLSDVKKHVQEEVAVA